MNCGLQLNGRNAASLTALVTGAVVTFNHTNFSTNNANVTSGGTSSASVTQANPGLASFGEILGANNPRIMQFALKFSL